MKKFISILTVGILVLSGLVIVSGANDRTFDFKTEKKQIIFSEPIIKDEGEYVTVNLKEATTLLLDAEKPALPVVTQVFTFPFKTKINHVEVTFSKPKNMILSKDIKPTLKPIMLNAEAQSINQIEKNIEIYSKADLYPSTTFSYTVGAGLAIDEHVIYLSIKCYPVRYSPAITFYIIVRELRL